METNNLKDSVPFILGLTKNPVFKIAVYFLVSMIIGIGFIWVLLGVFSPVLLMLLIRHW
jgi:hypothetical protein